MRIAITGDVGSDVFTLYQHYRENGSNPDSRLVPKHADDVFVPSGAGFMSEVLRALLADDSVIDLWVPGHRRDFDQVQTSQRIIAFLRRYPPEPSATIDRADIYRIGAMAPLDIKETPSGKSITGPDHRSPRRFDKLTCGKLKLSETSPYDYLVIEDWSGPPRDEPALGPVDMNGLVALIRKMEPAAQKGPNIFVDLGGEIPHPASDNRNRFTSEIWRELQFRSKQVCVVVSANRLRKDGAAISRRLSWEQTIEDLATDLRLHAPLRLLSRFGHIIVRFGLSAALHLHWDGEKHEGQFAFTPDARDGIVRDPPDVGRIFG